MSTERPDSTDPESVDTDEAVTASSEAATPEQTTEQTTKETADTSAAWPPPVAGPETLEEFDGLPSSEYGLATRLSAEAFGTYILVLVSVGTMLYGAISGLDALGVALASGLMLAGLYAAFAHVSGAHLNPAVSLGSALGGRTRALDALAYMITQLLAGIAAVATLVVTVPSGIGEVIGHTDDTAMLLATANGWGDLSPLSRLSSGSFTFGLPTAVLMLVIGSAALVGVILAARPSGRSAIAVGATYAAILLITIPIMNGGVNPARSTGVAVLTAIKGDPAAFGQLWLFWVAPLIGGAIAGLAKLALGKRELDSWVNAADIDDDANA